MMNIVRMTLTQNALDAAGITIGPESKAVERVLQLTGSLYVSILDYRMNPESEIAEVLNRRTDFFDADYNWKRLEIDLKTELDRSYDSKYDNSALSNQSIRMRAHLMALLLPVFGNVNHSYHIYAEQGDNHKTQTGERDKTLEQKIRVFRIANDALYHWCAAITSAIRLNTPELYEQWHSEFTEYIDVLPPAERPPTSTPPAKENRNGLSARQTALLAAIRAEVIQRSAGDNSAYNFYTKLCRTADRTGYANESIQKAKNLIRDYEAIYDQLTKEQKLRADIEMNTIIAERF